MKEFEEIMRSLEKIVPGQKIEMLTGQLRLIIEDRDFLRSLCERYECRCSQWAQLTSKIGAQKEELRSELKEYQIRYQELKAVTQQPAQREESTFEENKELVRQIQYQQATINRLIGIIENISSQSRFE